MATPSGGWQTDLVTVAGQPRLVTEPSCVYVRAALDPTTGVIAHTGQRVAGDPIHVWDSRGRVWVGPSAVYGVQSVGIVARPGGGFQITWVQTDLVYRRADLDAELREIRVTRAYCPNVTGRQGFLDCPLDSEPIWTDLRRFTWVRPASGDPVALYLWMTRGDWTIGQDAQVDRLLAFQHSTKTLHVAYGSGGQVPSRLAVDEQGNPWVLPAGASRVIARREFQPYTPPPKVYLPVTPFNGPLWFTPLCFGEPGPDVPRNGHIPVTQGAPWLPVHGPDWAYVAGKSDGNPASIEAAIAHAQMTTEREIVAYVPKAAFDALPTSADVQGIECYIWGDETDDEWIARRSAAIDRCPGDVALIVQWYDNFDKSKPDLRRVVGLVSKLAAKHRGKVKAIIPFSAGQGRGSGWSDHPEIHDGWWQWFRTISTPVVLPPLPDPPNDGNNSDTDTPTPPVVEEPAEPEPAPPRHGLALGEVLLPGDRLDSPDGQTWLHLQAEDGKLVLYHRDPGGTVRALWAPEYVAGPYVDHAVLQDDGNFVVYRGDGLALWASGTEYRGIEHMRVKAGRVVFVGTNNAVVNQLPPIESKPAETKKPGSWLARLFGALFSWGRG